MLVLKFGGKAAGSPEGIKNIINILNDTEHRGDVPVVVISAFPGVTDALVTLAHTAADGKEYAQLLEALNKRFKDYTEELLKASERETAYKKRKKRHCRTDKDS